VLSGATFQRRLNYGLTIYAEATDINGNNVTASLEKNIPMGNKIRNPRVVVE
jgi:hypothetical protein